MDPAHRLKLATSALHKQVDRHSLMKRLVAKDLGCAEYQLILLSQLKWLEQLQPLLNSLSLVDHFAPHHKINWLSADLLVLSGMELLSPSLLNSDTCIRSNAQVAITADAGSVLHTSENRILLPIPKMANASRAFALGIHYVVEGSTLGAQFIAPRVEQSLGRNDITHFYRGYGSNVMSRWRDTLEILNHALLSDEEQQLAISGAQAAFGLMLDTLEFQVRSNQVLNKQAVS